VTVFVPANDARGPAASLRRGHLTPPMGAATGVASGRPWLKGITEAWGTRSILMDEETAEQIRGLAAESHPLEAKVRQAILEYILSEAGDVVSAREIRDVAEAFAWVTDPGQAHGSRENRD
jgi:hypothetical protein